MSLFTDEQMEKIKAFLNSLVTPLKNSKTVTDVEGNDIEVETEGEIAVGDKVNVQDGAHKLPDGRTLIVKGGVIEQIEDPTTDANTAPDENNPQNEGEGEGEEPDDKDKEIAALKAEIEELKKCEEEEKKELENLRESSKSLKAKAEQFDKISAALEKAGGIDAVMKAVSANPSQASKSNALPEDDYERLKAIAERCK